jgi:hypothetical protein
MAIAQFLEPLKALLLQMVFCDQGHGRRPKNLQMAFGVREISDPGKAFTARRLAAEDSYIGNTPGGQLLL